MYVMTTLAILLKNTNIKILRNIIYVKADFCKFPKPKSKNLFVFSVYLRKKRVVRILTCLFVAS